MKNKILITSSSFLDTPGIHLTHFEQQNFDIQRERGPLTEHQMLDVISKHGPFDGIIAGEDSYTEPVLEKLTPKTKVISRYGVGLDKIDLKAAEKFNIKITNTPGVNHTTVTELTFGLLFSIARQIPEQNNIVHSGNWRRLTGTELCSKTWGIVGFGKVGREVAKRAMSFGINVIIYNTSWSEEQEKYIKSLTEFYNQDLFEQKLTAKRVAKIEDLLSESDIISIHISLSQNNNKFFNRRRLSQCRKGVLIVNVSRGALIDQDAMAHGIKSGYIGGFAADVLDPEPVEANNPLLGLQRVVITPHIGSRTNESVVRQGQAALNNLLLALK